MLTEKTIAAIAQAAGLKADELANAITDEQEKELEVNVTKTFTSDEWTKLEESIDSEKQSKYEEGKKYVIRDLKKEVGLDYEGRDQKEFLDKFKTKVLEDSDKDPEGRIKDFEKDIDALRTQLSEKETQFKTLASEKERIETRSEIARFLPEKAPEGLNREDMLTIIESNLQFGTEDGKKFVKKGGEVLKDQTRNNVSWEDAIIDFTTERKWRSQEGGRGDGDSGGGSGITDPKKARKMSDLDKYFEEKDINPLSEEARGIINEAAKEAKEAKEEFVYD